MNKIFEILSNREIALLFWSMVVFGFVLFNKQARGAILHALKALFAPIILIVNILLFDYTLLVVNFLQRARFWDVTFAKDTIVWTLGVATVLTFNAASARNTEHFKKIVQDVVKWTIILEFIINFYNFSLLTEIIILPILTIVVLLQTYVGLKPEYKNIESVLKAISSIFGLALLAFTIYGLTKNPSDLLAINSLKSFFLPIVLTLLFLPFVYILALYSQYESLFLRLKFLEKEDSFRRALKWQILKVANINLDKLSNISGNLAKILLMDNTRSLDEIKRISRNDR